MKSIAIWYEPNNEKEEGGKHPELDLHINHWKLPKDEYILDVGIKVTNHNTIENICLYIPQKDETPIEDLGKKICTTENLLPAIFNEDYTVNIANTKFSIIIHDKKAIFVIYHIDIKANDVTQKSEYEGAIIKITHKKWEGEKELPIYYRIRLNGKFIKELSYYYRPQYSFLESLSSLIEVIELRINDTRNLNPSLLEKISKEREFRIRLVHLFVMRPISNDLIISSHDDTGIRQLEDVWKTYIGINDEKYLAYHIKDKIKNDNISIDSFISLLKFRFENRNLRDFLIYLTLFSILFGVLGNCVYDLLKIGKDYLCKIF